jgi:hypothetical protein
VVPELLLGSPSAWPRLKAIANEIEKLKTDL